MFDRDNFVNNDGSSFSVVNTTRGKCVLDAGMEIIRGGDVGGLNGYTILVESLGLFKNGGRIILMDYFTHTTTYHATSTTTQH